MEQLRTGNQDVDVHEVLDDCLARRFHAKPPSEAIDVSLCDAACREAAREMAAALAHGGTAAALLSAGPLCDQVGRIVRQIPCHRVLPRACH